MDRYFYFVRGPRLQGFVVGLAVGLLVWLIASPFAAGPKYRYETLTYQRAGNTRQTVYKINEETGHTEAVVSTDPTVRTPTELEAENDAYRIEVDYLYRAIADRGNDPDVLAGLLGQADEYVKAHPRLSSPRSKAADRAAIQQMRASLDRMFPTNK